MKKYIGILTLAFSVSSGVWSAPTLNGYCLSTDHNCQICCHTQRKTCEAQCNDDQDCLTKCDNYYIACVKTCK